MDRIRGSHAMVVAIIALLIAVVGPANAIEPAKISVSKVSKALKLAKKADKRSKRALKLARRVGAKGAPGAQGEKGDTGAAGAAGATSVLVRTATASGIGPSTSGTATAVCNAGERAVGGGSAFNLSHLGDQIMSSRPTDAVGSILSAGQTPTAWLAKMENSSAGGTKTLTVWVICASP